MNWIHITTPEQIELIRQQSYQLPQLIFKYSTRCSISSMALNRFERAAPPTGIDFYFLDLIKYRNLSHIVAETFKVQHESPQVLLIKNGECVYNESHSGIDLEEITEQAVRA